MSPYHDLGFAECVNEDLADFLCFHKLKLTKSIIPLVAVQTINGHAQNGHCAFRENAYPNATIRDIIQAIDKDVLTDAKYSDADKYTDADYVAEWRESLIGKVVAHVERIIHGKQLEYCRDSKMYPLLGLESIKDSYIKDHAAFLTGVYFAGIMDNYGWRRKVFDKYGIEMGGGESYRTSLTKLEEMQLTIDAIETTEHTDDDIRRLKGVGLILEHGKISDDTALVYFRKKIGMGSIDDFAVIIMHLLYGKDAALGTILGDAVDTFDKYTLRTVEGGYDEMLSSKVKDNESEIRKHYPDFSLASKEATFVKAMSLIAGANYSGVSHCSVRYFNEIDPRKKITALESHFMFAGGTPVKAIPPVYISHPALNITNRKLYSKFRARLGEKFPELEKKLG